MNIYPTLRQDIDFLHEDGYTIKHYALPMMPCFVADQVMNLILMTPPDNRPSMEALNLAPPFDRYFIEAAPDAAMLERNGAILQIPTPVRNEKTGQLTVINEFLNRVVYIGMDVTSIDVKHTSIPVPDGTRWFIRFKQWYWAAPPKGYNGYGVCRSHFHFVASLDAEGFILPINENLKQPDWWYWKNEMGIPFAFALAHEDANEHYDLHPGEAERVFGLFLLLFYAINSLHNKSLISHQVEPSRQQRRHAQRHQKEEPPTYTVIEIKDYIELFHKMQQAHRDHTDVPMHAVIGHFKKYGRDGRKLLFGKYAGTIWHPSHLRGNPDKGVREHDYEIGAEAAHVAVP